MMNNSIQGGRKDRPLKLTCERMVMPVFCNDQLYRPSDEPDTAYLKLFRKGDWLWAKVRLRPPDDRYTFRRRRGPSLRRKSPDAARRTCAALADAVAAQKSHGAARGVAVWRLSFNLTCLRAHFHAEERF